MFRFLSLSTDVPYDLSLMTTEDGMPLRVFWWRCSRHYAIFEFTGSWSINSKHEFGQLKVLVQLTLFRFCLNMTLPYGCYLWILLTSACTSTFESISSSSGIPRPTETEETKKPCPPASARVKETRMLRSLSARSNLGRRGQKAQWPRLLWCWWLLGGHSFRNPFRTLGLSINQGICNVSWTPSTANVGPSSQHSKTTPTYPCNIPQRPSTACWWRKSFHICSLMYFWGTEGRGLCWNYLATARWQVHQLWSQADSPAVVHEMEMLTSLARTKGDHGSKSIKDHQMRHMVSACSHLQHEDVWRKFFRLPCSFIFTVSMDHGFAFPVGCPQPHVQPYVQA